jgi:cytidylate kinase
MAILTVSGEYGSRGREIGRTVARELGYSFVNKEKILDEVRGAGEKWEQWAKEYDGRCPTTWERYDWSFQGFAALIQSVILKHATKDRVVLMGRGGNFLLAGIAHALRARVTAPLEARVVELAKRESLSDKAARWLIEKTDHERACFIYSLYRAQWDDPQRYDLNLNTAQTSAEESVKILIEGLAARDLAKSEGSQRDLEMRALAARVKAGIMTTPGVLLPTLNVEVDGRQLLVQGVIHNRAEMKRVEEIARSLAADAPLRFDLQFRL